MQNFGRRQFLAGGLGGALLTVAKSSLAGQLRVPKMDPEKLATNESFWAKLKSAFEPHEGPYHYVGGGHNPLPSHTLDRLEKTTRHINADPYQRHADGTVDREKLRRRLAALIHCQPGELALARWDRALRVCP